MVNIIFFKAVNIFMLRFNRVVLINMVGSHVFIQVWQLDVIHVYTKGNPFVENIFALKNKKILHATISFHVPLWTHGYPYGHMDCLLFKDERRDFTYIFSSHIIEKVSHSISFHLIHILVYTHTNMKTYCAKPFHISFC